MNVKVIQGLSKVRAAVSDMVENGCRVVFDSEATGGSYIWNRKRNEYYKVFHHNGIYILPVWERIPEGDEECDEQDQQEIMNSNGPMRFYGPSPRT